MKTYLQEAVELASRKLKQFDQVVTAVDNKIQGYQLQAPQLLQAACDDASIGLRKATINEIAVRSRYETFRYLNGLQGRNWKRVSTFSGIVICVLAVLMVGGESVINSELLKELYDGNKLQGATFAFVFAALNLFSGSVLIGWFGVRYLGHVSFAKKLFPGLFCVLLGTTIVLAMAFYLGLLVAGIENLPTLTANAESSASVLKALYEANIQTAVATAKLQWRNLEFSAVIGKQSLIIVIVTVLFALVALLEALFVSDIYPGFSAIGRELENAEIARDHAANDGKQKIGEVEDAISSDLHASLARAEGMVGEVEGIVATMQEFLSEANQVTGVLRQGYHDCVTQFRTGVAVPYGDEFVAPLEWSAPIVLADDRTPPVYESELAKSSAETVRTASEERRIATHQLTSTLAQLRAATEQNLDEINSISREALVEADHALTMHGVTQEDLSKLRDAIKACAEEYKSKLDRKLGQLNDHRNNTIAVAAANPIALNLETPTELNDLKI